MKQKTAAIYNRWLHELGGGEQLTFGYAKVLKEMGYTVSLITHKKVDLAKARRKFNINLNNFEIDYKPIKWRDNLKPQPIYDIFICNSFLDGLPNLGKHGIFSVMFPNPISFVPLLYLKEFIFIPLLKKLFLYPVDFHQVEYIKDKQKVATVIKNGSSITFNRPIKKVTIQLIFDHLSTVHLEEIGLKGSNNEPLNNQNFKTNHRQNLVTITAKNNTPFLKMKIIIPTTTYKSPIYLKRVSSPGFSNFFYRIFRKLFVRQEKRLHGVDSIFRVMNMAETYNITIAISKFVKKWISNYWNKEAKVLYPPVNTTQFQPKKKKNIITHIGRFFVGGHSKKQLELAQAFVDLIDSGLTGWELHFIGGVANGIDHQRYFESVKQLSKDYPIVIKRDASFKELKETLETAKIYWHATGLNQDVEKRPILLEHFGITTVEAMAAGCVPIVVNHGGQAEIVTKDAGFKFETVNELKQYTKKVMANESLRKKLSHAAVTRSQHFSQEAFENRFKQLVTESIHEDH